MQSEEEKYYLMDQFLKGKLSENDEAIFKGSFSADAFRNETIMHKLANEAIEENYLLGIRAATKKVIKRNAAWNTGKWIAGTCFIASGIIAYSIYTKNEIKQLPDTFMNQVAVKSTVVLPSELIKPAIKKRSTIKPDKINQTTNLSKTELQSDIQQEEEKYIVLPNSGIEDLKNTATVIVIQPAEITKQEINIAAPTVIVPEKTKPSEKLATVAPAENSELMLNPNREELIYFPVEGDFNGELVVFDATGNTVLKRQIRDGFPKEWDGTLESGGKVTAGQYVFLIKSLGGKEVKQGSITVVR